MRQLYNALTAATLAFSVGTINAQPVNDVVSTGANYANQVWYSMENGEVDSEPLDNWDLAFEIAGFTAGIRANTQKGLNVYQTPHGIEDWTELESLDPSWPRLYNDPTSWSRGAFNLFSVSDFDLGWGTYNPITHFVTGDSLYVIELSDGTPKKLRIDALAGGIYVFTYANLDGSDEVQVELHKDDFPGKNFGYFSFETGEVLDREPPTEDWDITFTRYTVDFDGTPYGVSGVLHNKGVVSAQVDGVPVNEAAPWEVGFTDEINQVGHDWKNFDFSTGWTLAEDRSYFIQALNGNVYQLVFTGFGGQATGDYEFTVETFSTLQTDESKATAFKLFPNPVRQGSPFVLEGEFKLNSRIEVFTIDGRMVHEEVVQSLNRSELGTTHFSSGAYLIRLVEEDRVSTQKLIIE
jgi:hypothetical protein